MITLLDFEKLYFLLNFTDAQRKTSSQTLCQAFDPNEYYDALKIFYSAEIVKTYAPEIASACIDAIITEDEHPKAIVLIICELATAEIFSTREQTQTHLTKIKNSPKKEEFHVALSWLNILGLPNEMIQYYFLPDHIEEPNDRPAIIRQIGACFSILASADSRQCLAVTSLVKLLEHAYSLPYDEHIHLLKKVFLHHNIHELNEALEILCSSALFTSFTDSSELCLNTVLQDQSTPEATAYILSTIVSHDVFVSEERTQNYCNKVARYPEKAYLCAIISALEKELKWPPTCIQACILDVLNIQKPRSENISNYVNYFLSIMAQFNQVVSEDSYPHIAPLLNPNSISGFLHVTSFLQNTDQELDEELDNIEYNSKHVKERLNGFIPSTFPILQIYCEALASLAHHLEEKIERHLPSQPSIRKQIFESRGHALFLASHLFFGGSNRVTNVRNNDDDVEDELNPQALIVSSCTAMP